MQNQGINLFRPVSESKAKNMSPLVLASVGDSVQTLYIRKTLALSHDFKNGALHRLTAEMVNATAQAKAFEGVRENLSEEELSIYRRARNSKTGSSAKNAKITDYRKATGLEAVIGYLYLTGRFERLEEILLKTCLTGEENKGAEEDYAQSNTES